MTPLNIGYRVLDPPSGAARAIEFFRDSPRWRQLHEVLEREQEAAEATLGRPLIAPWAFAADCLDPNLFLGGALNREANRIDQLESERKNPYVPR
jgi:hypothetical protein